MAFEFNLKALISKTSKEYDFIAKNDPVVQSIEDGTSRGDELDRILAEQQLERKELWDKLYSIEKKRVEEGKHCVIKPPVTEERKELSTLMTLDQQIIEKLEKEMNKLELEERPNETISELQYREKLDLQVLQLEESIQFLKNQLNQVQMSINSDTQVLKECKTVNELLIEKEQSLKDKVNENQKSADKLRAELLLLGKKYKQDILDMSEFLDDYFPPHPVDGAGPLGDECDLKMLLEQLLNESFKHPENPYLELRPGEYWSPYIGTLIKGGIAQYHPENANLICLENFRL